MVKFYLFIAILCISCAEKKNKKNHIKNTLIYNVDDLFFSDVDTANFQNTYDSYSKVNFNYKYFLGIFKVSTQSCLHCIVNIETNVITPLPEWSCDIIYKNNSDTIIIFREGKYYNYKWDEKSQNFNVILN
jgi:hypothetical protein